MHTLLNTQINNDPPIATVTGTLAKLFTEGARPSTGAIFVTGSARVIAGVVLVSEAAACQLVAVGGLSHVTTGASRLGVLIFVQDSCTAT